MIKHNLEDRLIAFSTLIIEISESVSKTFAGNHLSSQILRSGTSVSLNYGEAQSAESRKDFIHKIKIILKELRETMICLKLIKSRHLVSKIATLDKALIENNELISIFMKSIQTARKNDLENRK
ncbi:MAG: four helix bundle protein [Candidatus Marinimicrobia bacterium]|nr:four helix bundle protein [Candidatus Neomarinimicrobiota bacterium]